MSSFSSPPDDLRPRRPINNNNNNNNNMAGSYSHNNNVFSSSPLSSSSSAATATTRNPPHLPTPGERLALLAYPALLLFGTLFSLVNPETRASPYDAAQRAHVQDNDSNGSGGAAPSYFARKDNLLNVLFVKRGWAWITVAFAAFVLTHPAFGFSSSSSSSSSNSSSSSKDGNNNNSNNGGGGGGGGNSRGVGGSSRKTFRAAARWALVTAWWVLVTQWCFGPPLIDRGFRFTGGQCEVALGSVASASSTSAADRNSPGPTAKDVFTAAACRASGGRWSGGHDISGHVFLLVLGSCFLLQEVGWVVLRAGFLGALLDGGSSDRRRRRRHEERCVVMPDGAVKGAGVEAEAEDASAREEGGAAAAAAAELGFGGRFAMGVVALCLWMLLMTAIYFHTWFEKLTGLLTAAVGIYAVYYVPRFVPSIRAFVGLPGI